jgi:3-deoxy-D-manno-octulosonate 8-phosphate phosphatase (KDO 8-P phosphatase)
MTEALTKRLASVRLFVTDVDGVLTDGSLWMGAETEIKRFSVRDGLGLQLLMLAGIRVAWITARTSDAVAIRARELGPIWLQCGVQDKAEALRSVAARAGASLEAVAYMGDDLNDLPAMNICGCSLCPQDAASLVSQNAHCVCVHAGGQGAVREACEMILDATGRLDDAVESYLAHMPFPPSASFSE